jgi:hypothetical protein
MRDRPARMEVERGSEGAPRLSGHVKLRAMSNSKVEAILVSLDHQGHTFGIVQNRSGDWFLSDSLRELSGTGVEGVRPATLLLTDSHSIVGGRLPCGAVTAELVGEDGRRVTCVVRDGAWIGAIADLEPGKHNPAVVWRSAHGVPVAPHLPAAWPRSQIVDTDVRCPACSALRVHDSIIEGLTV